MLEMINFMCPILDFIGSHSRWGSDSDSLDDVCLEKVIDLWMKMINHPPWPGRRSLCTATLTLLFSITTPNYVSLSPIP